jgi:hypothetical protein
MPPRNPLKVTCSFTFYTLKMKERRYGFFYLRLQR